VGKGLEWYVILQLLFYASASLVPLALPLAILLSSIMSFGKLSETFELVALKSAGISLVRTMLPLTYVLIIISVGAFYFSNNVIPQANLKFHSLLWDIRQQRPALDIKDGVFYGGIDNYSIRISKKDPDGRHIYGIMIYDHSRDRGNDVVLTAKSGEMYSSDNNRWLNLQLYNGVRYEEMPRANDGGSQRSSDSWSANRLSFKSYELKFDLSAFSLQRTREELFKDNYQMLNIKQLQYYIDSLDTRRGRKLDEVMIYSKPYFTILRDSSIIRAAATDGAKVKTTNKPLIEIYPFYNQKNILNKALGAARSLKESFRIQREELKTYDVEQRKYEMEWHRKFAISLACLTMFFIGAPLGAVIRKGGIGTPTVVAIIMFIVFYILTKMGEQLALNETLSVFVGLWLPTFILMPAGFYLIHKANTDRINYNFGATISHFFKKYVNKPIQRLRRNKALVQ